METIKEPKGIKAKVYLVEYLGGVERENYIIRDSKTGQPLFVANNVDELADFLRGDTSED